MLSQMRIMCVAVGGLKLVYLPLMEISSNLNISSTPKTLINSQTDGRWKSLPSKVKLRTSGNGRALSK